MSEPDHEISKHEHATGGRYATSVHGVEAEMTYSRAGDHLIIIDHTDVPDQLRGLGLGQALVAKAVEDTRESGIKILPLCPFAAAQFRKNGKYHDILSR